MSQENGSGVSRSLAGGSLLLLVSTLVALWLPVALFLNFHHHDALVDEGLLSATSVDLAVNWWEVRFFFFGSLVPIWMPTMIVLACYLAAILGRSSFIKINLILPMAISLAFGLLNLGPIWVLLDIHIDESATVYASAHLIPVMCLCCFADMLRMYRRQEKRPRVE